MCNDSKLVCGIEIKIIESMITLVRDKYPSADAATYYLETKTGLKNTTGMTNIRDIISHFGTIISNTTTLDERKNQLATAEEHLRRAIVEPYERAANFEMDKVSQLYENFVETVIPAKRKWNLSDIPSRETIDNRIVAIRKKIVAGRQAKGENQWNEKWEQGVEDFIQGRSIIVKKAQPITIECVVRGYLTGSAWKEYQQKGEICGIKLKDGYQQFDKLNEPIFTPAAKSKEITGHDINITWDEAIYAL